MAYTMGEKINLGLGLQEVGDVENAVEPQIWIPGRAPTTLRPEVDKTLIRETRATRANSQGSVITSQRGVGNIEFNFRVISIGYILYNLLGKCESESLGDGVYKHTFTINQDDVFFNLLTAALSRPGGQDYTYPGTQGGNLTIRTPQDDLLNATLDFGAIKRETASDYTVDFDENDHYFRNHDVEIKIADTIEDLAGATAADLNSLEQAINNNRDFRQGLGRRHPRKMYTKLFEITGRMELDREDENYEDIFYNNESKAMRVTYTRDDKDIGGGKNPKIQITYPLITFSGFEPNRPLDDVEQQTIDYTAHADNEGNQFEIVIENTQPSYEPAES